MLRMSENFRALFYAPFYAAFAIGAYRAEGVDVELVPSTDPAGTTAELLAGKVDAMWGGPLRLMMTREADPSIDQVCFCDVIVRDPFFVIGREPRPNFKLADLVGLRFASVSEVPTPWVCLQHDLRLAGIDPASLNRSSGPGMAENAAALRAGTLDAAQMFQPYAETLIAEGGGHIWYAAATRGPAAYTALSARSSVMQARRDEFAAVVRGMYRTLRWFAATPAANIARALATFLPDVPQPILAAAIERYRALGLYTVDPVMPRDGFDWLQSAMRAGGLLQRSASFDACVDNSLAEAAVAGG